MQGDGTSLWTLTHSDDFAKGFVPLLGNTRTIGDAFHITSDDVLTWNQITMILANAAGAEARIVHVPSDVIAATYPHWGDALLGGQRTAYLRHLQAAQRGTGLCRHDHPRAGGAGDHCLARRGSVAAPH